MFVYEKLVSACQYLPLLTNADLFIPHRWYLMLHLFYGAILVSGVWTPKMFHVIKKDANFYVIGCTYTWYIYIIFSWKLELWYLNVRILGNTKNILFFRMPLSHLVTIIFEISNEYDPQYILNPKIYCEKLHNIRTNFKTNVSIYMEIISYNMLLSHFKQHHLKS